MHRERELNGVSGLEWVAAGGDRYGLTEEQAEELPIRKRTIFADPMEKNSPH
jgi:hypothetical protein